VDWIRLVHGREQWWDCVHGSETLGSMKFCEFLES
jgi:hypothetical protein